jgi:hypothetical protein
MLRLICSQFSTTLSSPILRSSSAGSRVANIAAGFGNGIPAPAPPKAGPAPARRRHRAGRSRESAYRGDSTSSA